MIDKSTRLKDKINLNLSYYKQIDTLRFFAVVLVCISHWLPNHDIKYLQLGRLGVELFFVISGFLITGILLRLNEYQGFKWKIIKTFFIRRTLRIFPIYYLVVVLTYFLHDGHFDFAIWWNLSYMSNFYMLKIEAFPGIMSHFWSLSVEEHFYILWPTLILAIPRVKAVYAISLVAIIGIVSRILFYVYGYSSIYPKIFTISCFDAFALGGLMSLALLYYPKIYIRIRNAKLVPIVMICALVYAMCLAFQSNQTTLMDYVGFRFCTSVLSIYVLAYAITSTSKVLNNDKLIFLGKISYSMYLFHNFVPGMLLGMPYPSSIYLRIPIFFIVLILISYIGWKLVESPFNVLKKKFPYRMD